MKSMYKKSVIVIAPPGVKLFEATAVRCGTLYASYRTLDVLTDIAPFNAGDFIEVGIRAGSVQCHFAVIVIYYQTIVIGYGHHVIAAPIERLDIPITLNIRSRLRDTDLIGKPINILNRENGLRRTEALGHAQHLVHASNQDLLARRALPATLLLVFRTQRLSRPHRRAAKA